MSNLTIEGYGESTILHFVFYVVVVRKQSKDTMMAIKHKNTIPPLLIFLSNARYAPRVYTRGSTAICQETLRATLISYNSYWSFEFHLLTWEDRLPGEWETTPTLICCFTVVTFVYLSKPHLSPTPPGMTRAQVTAVLSAP